jgi:hypothetical protein
VALNLEDDIGVLDTGRPTNTLGLEDDLGILQGKRGPAEEPITPSMTRFIAGDLDDLQRAAGSISKFTTGLTSREALKTDVTAWTRSSNEFLANIGIAIKVLGEEAVDEDINKEALQRIIRDDPDAAKILESIATDDPEWWKDIRARAAQIAIDSGNSVHEHYAEIAAQYPPPEHLQGKNIIDNPEIMSDPLFWSDGLFSMGPQVAMSMIPGAGAYRSIEIGGKVLKLTPQATSILARIGAAVMSGGVGGIQEGAGTFQEALALGKTPEEARAAFFQMTMASAALNAFSVNFMLKKVPKGLLDKTFRMMTSGVVEGGTEAFEEVVNAFILDKDMTQALKEGATVGLLAMFTGFGGAIAGGEIAGPQPTDFQNLDSTAIKHADALNPALGKLKTERDAQPIEIIDREATLTKIQEVERQELLEAEPALAEQEVQARDIAELQEDESLTEDQVVDEIINRIEGRQADVSIQAEETRLIQESLPTATNIKAVDPATIPDLGTPAARAYSATMPNGSEITVLTGADIAVSEQNIETIRKTYVETGLMSEEDLQAGKFVVLGKNQAIGQSGVITLAKEGARPEILNEEVFELAEKTVLTPEEIAAAGPDLEARSKAYAAWDGQTQTPQGVFEKIRDFFKGILARFKAPALTREEVFRRVREGEVFGREAAPGTEETFLLGGRRGRRLTGITEGVFSSLTDKQLRFEIDDSKARLKIENLQSIGKFQKQFVNKNDMGLTLKDVLEHDELYAAYPGFADMRVASRPFDEKGGSLTRGYMQSTDAGGVLWINEALAGSLITDTLIHEIQHAIQDVEEFAVGGSPDTIRTQRDTTISDIRRMENEVLNSEAMTRFMDNFKSEFGKDWPGRFVVWDIAAQEAIAKKLEIDSEDLYDFLGKDENYKIVRREIQDLKLSRANTLGYGETPLETYLRLAGEVEARDTVSRMKLSKEERIKIQPYISQEIPLSQMITQFKGGQETFAIELINPQPLDPKAETFTTEDIAEGGKFAVDTFKSRKMWGTAKEDGLNALRESVGRGYSTRRLYRGMPVSQIDENGILPLKRRRAHDGIKGAFFTTSPQEALDYAEERAEKGEESIVIEIDSLDLPESFYMQNASMRPGLWDKLAFAIPADIDMNTVKKFTLTEFKDSGILKLEGEAYANQDRILAGPAEDQQGQRPDPLESSEDFIRESRGPEGRPDISGTQPGRAGRRAPDVREGRRPEGQEPTRLDQTQTPAFKEWFGDSKVVDENGQPLVVYHGTNQEFGNFEKGRRGASTQSVSAKEGFFFTDSADEASDYAELAGKKVVANVEQHEKEVERIQSEMEKAEAKRDFDKVDALTIELENLELGAIRAEPQGQNVVPAYLKISNPLMREDVGSITTGDVTELIEQAQREGKDGVILTGILDRPEGGGETATHYITFEPTQIKSATGNIGTFDPTDPRITFALELTPDARPIFDPAVVFDDIRLQTKNEAKALPAFMEDNPTWSEEEVIRALDKAHRGQTITPREADIVQAAMAEAATNFYNEVINYDEAFLNPVDVLEEGELDVIIENGVREFIGKLKVEAPVQVAPDVQKLRDKLKTRQKTIKKQGAELARLGRIMGDRVETIWSQEKEIAKQAQIIKEQGKENKTLKARIEKKDTRIKALRQKGQEVSVKMALERQSLRGTTKGIIRRTTGQQVNEELNQLARSLKRQEQIAREAEKQGRRNLEAEQEIENLRREIGTIKQQIGRATGLAPQAPLVREDVALKAGMVKAVRAAREAQRAERKLADEEKRATSAEQRQKLKEMRAEKRESVAKERARIQEMLERRQLERTQTAVRQKIKKQIIKALRTTKPTKQAGKPVGKFTPEIQRTLDKLRAAARLSPEEAINTIADNMERYQETMPPEDVVLENKLISMVHGLDTRTVSEMDTLLQEIRALIDEGRMINELRRFNRQARIERDVAEAVDVVSGGKGIPATISAGEKAAALSVKRTQGLTDRAKRWFSTTGKSFVGWKDLLDILSRLDPSKPFQSRLSEIGDVLDVKNAEKRGIRETTEQIQELYKQSYGLDSTRAVKKKIQEDSKPVNLGTFTDMNGNAVELEFTRAEARKRYMEFQDPTLAATFTEGMFYSQDMKAAITEMLTPQDKSFAFSQLQFYRDYYSSINEPYQLMYGIDLPFNEFYSPIRREGITKDESDGIGEFLQEINLRAAVSSGSLKSRVDNVRPIAQQSDLAVLEQHMTEMEHFKAWAERVRELRGVFGNAEFRTAVKLYHDPNILGIVDNFIADMTRGGIERAGKLNWLDKWRGRIARSALAVKASIGVKQLTSFIAYADAMPVTSFTKNYAQFWANPIENTKFLLEHSELLRSRGKHMERDIQTALKTDEYSTWRKHGSFLNMLMLNVQAGDQGAIVMGGWPLVKYHMDQGKSVAEAIRIFEQVTESTQQSADISELSLIQRMGSFAKLFTMFRSSPNQYVRKEVAAIRNLIAGRQGVTQTAKTLAIFHFLLPMFFQFVSDGFTWDEDEQKRAMILGPLNGVFILGDILEGIVRHSLGLRRYDDEVPVMSVADDAVKAMKLVEPDDLTPEETLKAVRALAATVGSLTGIPAQQAVDIATGIDDILTGDFERGASMFLGWSPSVADKRTGGDRR